jgi:hypothetical protein
MRWKQQSLAPSLSDVEAAEFAANARMSKKISLLYEKVASEPWRPYPWETKEWKALDESAAAADALSPRGPSDTP